MKHDTTQKVAGEWHWESMIQANSNLPTVTENWAVQRDNWPAETVLDTKNWAVQRDKEIEDLKREIKKLKSESRHIRVLKIRECDYSKAKDEILALVQKHRAGVSTIEIAEELCLEPEIVLKALSELIDDGKIGKNNTGN